MNFLRNFYKSVTGSGRNGEQNIEKAQKESDTEAMDVESETETGDDGVSDPNVSGTTDKFCITSSESETEFCDARENMISGHKLTPTAVLKEAKDRNNSQTKEGQAKEVNDMRERNAEKAHATEKENLPKRSADQEKKAVAMKRKAEEAAGNKRKKGQPSQNMKAVEGTIFKGEMEVIEIIEEDTSGVEDEEIVVMDISEQNDQNQENSRKSERDADQDLITEKALRRDLKMWIKNYDNISEDTLCFAVKELSIIRSRYRRCQYWEKDALSLRDVQERLRQATQNVKNIAGTKQKSEAAAALRQILTLSGEIQVPFPSLKEINEFVLQVEGNSSGYPSLKLSNVEQLPGHLKARLESMGANADLELKQLHCELESTMKGWRKQKAYCYEYQTIVGVLHLFGFNLVNFSFRSWLSQRDFVTISEMLAIHLANVKNTQQKQTYILNIALCDVENRETAVMYMIKHMPNGACREVTEAIQRSRGEDAINLEKLRSEIEKMLPETLLKDNLPAFVEAFRSQLKLANRTETFQQAAANVCNSIKLDSSVAKLLKVLNMTKYHPQKLTCDEVIQ